VCYIQSLFQLGKFKCEILETRSKFSGMVGKIIILNRERIIKQESGWVQNST